MRDERVFCDKTYHYHHPTILCTVHPSLIHLQLRLGAAGGTPGLVLDQIVLDTNIDFDPREITFCWYYRIFKSWHIKLSYIQFLSTNNLQISWTSKPFDRFANYFWRHVPFVILSLLRSKKEERGALYDVIYPGISHKEPINPPLTGHITKYVWYYQPWSDAAPQIFSLNHRLLARHGSWLEIFEIDQDTHGPEPNNYELESLLSSLL